MSDVAVKGLGFSFGLESGCAELFLKRKLSFPVSRMWKGKPIEQRGGHLGITEDTGRTADDVWQAAEELGMRCSMGLQQRNRPRSCAFSQTIIFDLTSVRHPTLGRVDSIANHPIRTLYDAGVIVTVNTDDVLMLGASVSEENIRLHKAGVFSTAELNQIRLNGLTDPVVAR